MNKFIFIAATIFHIFFCSTQAIIIHAHRGHPTQLPENTLPSFMSALENSADFLEFDTMMTKDCIVIVYDNFTLNTDRCAYKNSYPIRKDMRIKDLTLAEIKNIDCSAYQSTDFPTQRHVQGEIITLEELFHAITTSLHPMAKKVRFNIKLTPCTLMPAKILSPGKMCDAAYANLDYNEKILTTIITLVEKYKLTQRVIYQSFDIDTLHHLRTLVPTAVISLLQRQTLFEVIDRAKALKANIVSPHQELLEDKQSVDLFHSNGFKVIPWVVNDKAVWIRLIIFGVDGIITDYPGDLAAFIAENKDRCTIS